jgi:diguanylate cyclase (GGDEF)-like protein
VNASQRGRTAERRTHHNGRSAGGPTGPPAVPPLPSPLPSPDPTAVRLDLTDDPAAEIGPQVQEQIAAGEELARLGLWEDAYQRLRGAVELLHGPHHAELDRLRREHEVIREQARRDFLTASYNRRYLDDRLSTLLDDPAVTRSGMALAMVDIDHFKKVNDRYGHPFGDRVLQRVVAELDSVLSAAVPDGAFCARYGGEEFALVLPGYEPDLAVEVCERARLRIDRYGWLELDPALRVTVSVGVAHTVARPVDVEQLLVGADVLLYAAKGAGRNAVAYRRSDGTVALAGPASARRDIPQPASVD